MRLLICSGCCSCIVNHARSGLEVQASRPAPPPLRVSIRNCLRARHPATRIPTKNSAHSRTLSLSPNLIEARPKQRQDISRDPPPSFPPVARAHEMAGRWMGRERDRKSAHARAYISVWTHISTHMCMCVCLCVCVCVCRCVCECVCS
jgi:hypothetical protein